MGPPHEHSDCGRSDRAQARQLYSRGHAKYDAAYDTRGGICVPQQAPETLQYQAQGQIPGAS